MRKWSAIVAVLLIALVAGCRSCVSSNSCGKKVCIGGGVK